MEEARMSKGWRRLVAISCTLLLAGSVFLILGMTVWAQEQPQPTGTEQQPAQTTQQPAQTSQAQGLTIDYWEPQVGTRMVYYTEDLNDTHGDIFGTGMLGYWDVGLLYTTSISRINYASDYYYAVDAISNMNPCYFDLEGPWYFNMTTPYKYIEKVVGIHEAPDAAKFPQATYAVSVLVIASGGIRTEGYIYRSNDPAQKKWLEWGMTIEGVYTGDEYSTKEIIHYLSPSDRKTPVAKTVIAFPLSLGATVSYDAVYMEGADINVVSSSASYEVVAESNITVPAGTFKALLLRGNLTSSPDGEFTKIDYAWFVPDVGCAAEAMSLPNELGPLFEEATEIMVLEEQTGSGAPQQ